MEQDVVESTPDWELALPDIAMYYAEPIITYSNTPELLVVQIPIFLKRRNQVPMLLYLVHTAQVPMNCKTYENGDSQFTQIKVHQPYLAVRPNTYFVMHEPELRLCVKVQQWYMCETAKLQHTVQVHTCVSAIFYQQEAVIKTAQCVSEYIKDEKPCPKILDAGHQLVLSQLPAPWYLDCEGARGLVKHKATAYAVVNCTEFCECALQAGLYFLERTTTYCDEGKDVRDRKFEVRYVHNQLLFDVLKTRYKMIFKMVENQPDEWLKEVPDVQVPELSIEPLLDSEDNLRILADEQFVVHKELNDTIDLMIKAHDQSFFQNTHEWVMYKERMQKNFNTMAWTNKMSFVASIIAMVLLLAAIIYCLCYQQILRYCMGKTSDLPYVVNFPQEYSPAAASIAMSSVLPQAKAKITIRPLELPPMQSPDIIISGDDNTLVHSIVVICCVLGIIGIALWVWRLLKKFRYRSNDLRALFPCAPGS